MQIVDLINQLNARDIRLWVEQDQLRFNAPKGALTDTLLAYLRAHKTDLVEFLQSAQAANQQRIELPTVDYSTPQPLSYPQARIWLIDTLTPNNPALHLQSFFEMRGALDAQALEDTLNTIIDRHGILRSAYINTTEGIRQKIIDNPGLKLSRVNVDANITDAETLIQHLNKNNGEGKPLKTDEPTFNLENGEVCWARLFCLSNNHYLLQCCIHHIATDGWSMPLIATEIAGLYPIIAEHTRTQANGQTHEEKQTLIAEAALRVLPPLSHQYADFAHWQHAQPADKSALSFWHQALEGTSNLALPPMSARAPSNHNHNNNIAAGQSLLVSIDATRTKALNQLAQQQGATLFMVLKALFSTLLYRTCQQTRFCIGTPVAGRAASQLEPMVGCFINLLPLVAQNAPNQTFNALLEQTKNHCQQALAHQQLSFEALVQSLQRPPSTDTTPIFQALFALQNVPFDQATQLPGLRINALEAPVTGALYDLSLLANEWQDSIQLSFNYKTARISQPVMQRWADAFMRLLDQVLANPHCQIDHLRLLSNDEQTWQLTPAETHFNAPRHTRWQGQSLAGLFIDRCHKTPDAIALQTDTTTITYAELDRRSATLAQNLRQALDALPSDKQLAKQPRLAIRLKRSEWLVTTILACSRVGICYVPFEASYPTARLIKMADIADIDAVLEDDNDALPIQGLAPRTLFLNDLITPAKSDTTLNSRYGGPLHNLIFTSGSTGDPKGVMVPESAIVNRLMWMQEYLATSPKDRILQKTPYSFDVSVWEIWLPLISGATCVIAKDGGHQDAEYLATLINQAEITTCHFVPSMLAVFTHHLAQSATPGMPSLQHLVCSGETLTFPQVQETSAQLPNTQIHNLYGPTEAAIDVTFHPVDSSAQATAIGTPVDNCELYVLDQHLQPLPKGCVGDIAIGGVQLASGYTNRSDLTSDHFIDNPFNTGEKLYLTGDKGCFNESGELVYYGRDDRQVKINGFRVELEDIEKSINACPAVRQAAVIRHTLPSGLHQLVGYLQWHTGTPGENATSGSETEKIDAMKTWLERQLPSWMLPQRWISVDHWPLTSSGKLDLKSLPRVDSDISQPAYVAPRNAIETTLAEIWQEVLDIKQVGIYDDFFALGGHSLLAANAWVQVQARFDVNIALIELFQQPTIATIARAIQQALQDAEIKRKMSITGELSDDDEEITL
ncbi:Tyrocidine synthase 3 [BD1-7 clade bacterium]|uniref:Tyrocidine synthase 3 n=1 Tax=BD1-7 clade bacterium TaxID=2029982 RepID=A0A5S9QY49_9GAMM|nr:Tyrocidine synthase 3 [BD1-7 clade bacterium]